MKGLIELYKAAMEAQKEALKNKIRANTILINKSLGIVKGFPIDYALFPPMICGLEIKITDELPEEYSFAIVKSPTTLREELIAQVRRETVKAILYDFDKRCPNSSIGRSLWMDRIRSEYGVEVEE